MRIHSGALVVAVLAGVAAATGCDVSTAPRSQSVTVAVTADTIIAGLNIGGTVTWLQFTLPVEIHNGRTVAMSVDYCLASVEEPSGTDWKTVWAPICAVEGTTANTIAPGETKTIPWQITAAVSGPGGPKWGSPTVNGTYRFSLATAALGTLTSNTFTVNLLTTSTAAGLDPIIGPPQGR
jgi:hypothetical protein